MANSDTEICNLALRKLREQPIASLTEDTETARVLNTFYDDTRDRMLAMHPSNFAMRRQQLVQLADAPAFDWTHQYSLPTDPYCLRAYEVRHNGMRVNEWRVEGRNLLTNRDNDIFLLFVARVTDVTTYSATFVDALAGELAAQIAYALTRSATAQERMALFAAQAWKRHRHSDGVEGWAGAPERGVFSRVRDNDGDRP